uniref:Poly(A) RNA polymerase, mitochondrial n=1 Tax=Glossina brevipalpis TaxID=37001 RepID=A0A1A9WCN3_9MUSC
MQTISRRSYALKFYFKRLHSLNYSANIAPPDSQNSFEDVVLQRQLEATRSIVVQVSSKKSFSELYHYCSTYGRIIGAHHYCVQNEDIRHYILLEYENSEEASNAIDCSAYNDEMTGIPAKSPFLWFRASSKKPLKREIELNKLPSLCTVDGSLSLEQTELNALIRGASNIDEQLSLLYQNTKLNDLGVRLRFLAAFQVQQALYGMFPLANAIPFGSSVNGFGKMGCDLDLILRFDQEYKRKSQKYEESRLVFHTKQNFTNGRSQTQRQMESIGDMLQLFLPGICHVRRILQARVPIIKYHHEHLNLEIDLSMSNLSGFYMSELLYMFGEFDERVRPLTFCIRRWANACGLTNPSPGRWITNFSLTCLVIFFLQQTKQPVLPSINSLFKSATPDDIRITEDNINCSFARDFQAIGFNSKNKSRISELLLQFFEFYSQFDFHNKAISLNEGRPLSKPDHSAIYIVNPLEQALNVSKNMSLEECERLRIEVRNAAWILESEVDQNHVRNDEESWGLLNLFKTPEKAIIRPNVFFKPRILEVSELFDKIDEPVNDNSKSGDFNTALSSDFKNKEIKKRRQNTKKAMSNVLKQMPLNASASGTTSSNKTMQVISPTKDIRRGS